MRKMNNLTEHLSFVILDLSFVIARIAWQEAMTNDKSKMTNDKCCCPCLGAWSAEPDLRE